MKELERGGVQVISGTPGRVYDLIRRNALRMTQLKVMVLDEADEMLNRGFKEQIYDIYRFLPVGCQVVLMSATLPASVLEMTQKFMSDPIKILVKRDELTLGMIYFCQNIAQLLVCVSHYIQYDAFLSLAQTQRGFASFSFPSKRRNGSSIRCAICTTP